MSFLQFFVWGAWLITIGTYCFNAKSMGQVLSSEQYFPPWHIASLFMPALTGIIADKWINAEKLYGIFTYSCMD